jgi:hypothetical protein
MSSSSTALRLSGFPSTNTPRMSRNCFLYRFTISFDWSCRRASYSFPVFLHPRGDLISHLTRLFQPISLTPPHDEIRPNVVVVQSNPNHTNKLFLFYGHLISASGIFLKLVVYEALFLLRCMSVVSRFPLYQTGQQFSHNCCSTYPRFAASSTAAIVRGALPSKRLLT